MATQMGIGESSAREAVGHDGYPNFPGEPYIDNAETTVIENDPQRRLPPPEVPKSQHVTSHLLSGPSESHTPSSHLMDPPFARQLIRNLSVSSRLHAAGYSTTCPSKCAQCQWSPNEATLFDKVPRGHRYHRVDKLCLGTEVLSSNGITLSNNDSSGDCRSCKCTVGDSSLNREFGTQPSVAEGPSKGWASVVGLKTGGSGDANRFASYMLVIWLLPLAVSTFLVAALGIPHGARAGALLNSTGEFVVSKPPPRLRTPALWLLPLFPSAFQPPYTLEKLHRSRPASRLKTILRANCSETFCQLRLLTPTPCSWPITNMSGYDQFTPGEYLPVGYGQDNSHFEDAIYTLIPEYEEPILDYTDLPQTPTDASLHPIFMFTPHISPLETPQTSPATICGDPQWLPRGEFGDDSSGDLFSFGSPSSNFPSSPVETPNSFKSSPGDQIPQTPISLEPNSPPPPAPEPLKNPDGTWAFPQAGTSLEPSSPPTPAPEPVQNPDGTWACPQAGCTHPGHKRRCDARKHHKSHTKPYPCKMRNCTYRSSNAKDRERHYDTRHASTKHPACPAPGCGVLKSRVDNMRDHIRRKHQGMDYRSPKISALYPRRRGRR
ncbi:hypothetical protein HOY82DRAFT_494826 [Tuber indicum]|nr:hypothetical protein HOY82DRAFT_494826 [Tuber indicum]